MHRQADINKLRSVAKHGTRSTSSKKRLVLDLKEMTYLDSFGLGVLVGVYLSAKRQDCYALRAYGEFCAVLCVAPYPAGPCRSLLYWNHSKKDQKSSSTQTLFVPTNSVTARYRPSGEGTVQPNCPSSNSRALPSVSMSRRDVVPSELEAATNMVLPSGDQSRFLNPTQPFTTMSRHSLVASEKKRIRPSFSSNLVLAICEPSGERP